MENFSTLIENSKRAVRYWWLLLIIGIALFVVGILVFVYPTQSYLGMSLLFGWLMLISGILEVVLSSVNNISSPDAAGCWRAASSRSCWASS